MAGYEARETRIGDPWCTAVGGYGLYKNNRVGQALQDMGDDSTHLDPSFYFTNPSSTETLLVDSTQMTAHYAKKKNRQLLKI